MRIFWSGVLASAAIGLPGASTAFAGGQTDTVANVVVVKAPVKCDDPDQGDQSNQGDQSDQSNQGDQGDQSNQGHQGDPANCDAGDQGNQANQAGELFAITVELPMTADGKVDFDKLADLVAAKEPDAEKIPINADQHADADVPDQVKQAFDRSDADGTDELVPWHYWSRYSPYSGYYGYGRYPSYGYSSLYPSYYPYYGYYSYGRLYPYTWGSYRPYGSWGYNYYYRW